MYKGLPARPVGACPPRRKLASWAIKDKTLHILITVNTIIFQNEDTNYMNNCKYFIPVILAGVALFTSCSTLEKASMHGLNSGYYKSDDGKKAKMVYVDVTEEKIDVYNQSDKIIDKDRYLSIPLKNPDSLQTGPLKLKKQSLDIDITSILLKYRPSVYGLPPQLNSDLNIALYAGWRYDNYKLTSKTDPLNKHYHKVSNMGYDFGIFAGPWTTNINPFTTNNRTTNEYSGMIIQTGIAGFLESNIVSFGLAFGLDYLLNRDREIWIYNNKPWIGFVVGVALN